jgi:hypothetical protein
MIMAAIVRPEFSAEERVKHLIANAIKLRLAHGGGYLSDMISAMLVYRCAEDADKIVTALTVSVVSGEVLGFKYGYLWASIGILQGMNLLVQGSDALEDAAADGVGQIVYRSYEESAPDEWSSSDEAKKVMDIFSRTSALYFDPNAANKGKPLRRARRILDQLETHNRVEGLGEVILDQICHKIFSVVLPTGKIGLLKQALS